MIRPERVSILAFFLAASCASVSPTPSPFPPPSAATIDFGTGGHAGAPQVAPFSAAVDALPPEWKPFRLTRFKKLTEYQLVPQEGTVALRAVADASASGLKHDVVADPREYPWLVWKWKVPALNRDADNTLDHVEDSPARVVVLFAGGREQLSADEQINFDLAKAVGGNELPYATIMYIWENSLPVGTIITHHFSSRIKMIVAGSGRKNLDIWHEERVNLLEDYRRAFGEEPPHVKAVGVISDSDNTGARTVAYYGDIRFDPR